jgi:hypothetical protein
MIVSKNEQTDSRTFRKYAVNYKYDKLIVKNKCYQMSRMIAKNTIKYYQFEALVLSNIGQIDSKICYPIVQIDSTN